MHPAIRTLLILIAAAGVVFGGYVLVRQPPPPAAAPQTPAAPDGFQENGVLVRDNPGLKPGIWYLVYEKPGAPALALELHFDAESICADGPRQEVCDPEQFSSGTRVHLEGVREASTSVRVRTVSPAP